MDSMLWRRLDRPGHESAWLLSDEEGWRLTGTAIFEHDAQPCCLHYRIDCDRSWRTRSTRVTGTVGSEPIELSIEVGPEGRWRMNGEEHPELDGCVDIDLNFSPATNLLPIRRLDLAPGDEAPVRAAWLRFPSFTLEPLEQLYRRLGERSYRYESAGGRFTADLQVNAAGFVTFYPGGWQAERAEQTGAP